MTIYRGIFKAIPGALLGILVFIIYIYQHTLSFDHGPLKYVFPNSGCRYYPTCSEYMRQSIKRHGFYGIILGIRRLLRCHPFATGGSDPTVKSH